MQFPALQPSIELGTERVDRAALVVDVAMNGHALKLFPALNRADVPFYVSGNFLPRIEGASADRSDGPGDETGEESFIYTTLFRCR